jgi:hypothetical protein
MKTFFARLKAWYLRRFRGYVAPPRDPYGVPRGTAWQEHQKDEWGFTCRCGLAQAFGEKDYVIREQDHRENCEWQYGAVPLGTCSCPVTDARYIRICHCRLGHWKLAEVKP